MKPNNQPFQKFYEVPFTLVKDKIEYLPGDDNFVHMSFGYHYD